MIFISSPYSHPDKTIQQERCNQVAKVAALLAEKGECAFSPIVYGLELCKHVEMPTDFKFWETFCIHFLQLANTLYVLQLDGWETSVGVQAEIKYAEENFIDIIYSKINPIV